MVSAGANNKASLRHAANVAEKFRLKSMQQQVITGVSFAVSRAQRRCTGAVQVTRAVQRRNMDEFIAKGQWRLGMQVRSFWHGWVFIN
jgi:hypothetical protein